MAAATDPDAEDGFEHPALFYADPVEYLDGTVPFIEAALAAGEPAAAAVPRHNLEPLRRALGAAADRVLLIDMSDAGANPGRIIPGVLRSFVDAHPGRRVRIIGEPIWPGRAPVEYPACVQHEALLNRVFDGRAITKLCPYDVAGLDPRAIADARATHPELIDRDGRRPSGQFDPDRVLADCNRPLEPPPRRAIERVADRATLDNARWFAIGYGRSAGLSGAQLIDFEIAVTELLTNSISHGGGSGTFRVWTSEEHLVCEVDDTGRIADPLAWRLGAGARRGLGLVLVDQVVDLLRMHTGPEGTTVRIYLRRSTGEDVSPG